MDKSSRDKKQNRTYSLRHPLNFINFINCEAQVSGLPSFWNLKSQWKRPEIMLLLVCECLVLVKTWDFGHILTDWLTHILTTRVVKSLSWLKILSNTLYCYCTIIEHKIKLHNIFLCCITYVKIEITVTFVLSLL